MLHRMLWLAALMLLPLSLSGCVVAPAPGYYRPPVATGVYVAPRPYVYRPYGPGWGDPGWRGHGWGGPGWGGRGWGYGRPYGYWR